MTTEELENTVLELKEKLDKIIDNATEAEYKYNRGKSIEGFKNAYGDKLGKYEKQLKKLNGEDFDIYSEAFDEWDSKFSDMESDVYVTKLVSEIENKLSQLRSALEVDDEAEVQVTSNSDGEAEVQVEEEPTTESTTESTTDDKNDESEPTDELEEFTKELEKYR